MTAELGFLFADQALFDLPVDQRVIFRKLLGFGVAQAVNSAVSDLGRDGVRAERHHRADGRAHACLVHVQLGHSVDEIRGRLNGALEQP
jgi:hypothetical protein